MGQDTDKTPEPVPFKADPSVDMKTPKLQVYRMPASQFFAYAAELLKLNPPHLTDEPMIAQLKKIGIEPGKGFDISKVDPAVQRALDSAPQMRRVTSPGSFRPSPAWSTAGP